MNSTEMLVVAALFAVLAAVVVYLVVEVTNLREQLQRGEKKVYGVIDRVEEDVTKVSDRVTSAGKVLADVQLWREGLQNRIEQNKAVVSHKENFRIREVR